MTVCIVYNTNHYMYMTSQYTISNSNNIVYKTLEKFDIKTNFAKNVRLPDKSNVTRRL